MSAQKTLFSCTLSDGVKVLGPGRPPGYPPGCPRDRMRRFFAYNWKLPAYSGAFLLAVDNFSFLLTVAAFLLAVLASVLTVGAFLLTMGKCV